MSAFSTSAVAANESMHSTWSPEIRAMLRPSATFQQLAEQIKPEGSGRLRRFSFFAFLLGCMVSLITSQAFTLRHIVSGTICGSLILLTQIFALAMVRPRDAAMPFSQTVDLFFAGYGPWAIWILVFCSSRLLLASHPEWGGLDAILVTAALAAIWSSCIDYCFFREVFRRTPARAAGDLFLQRTISWGLALLLFGAGSLVPEIIRILGR